MAAPEEEGQSHVELDIPKLHSLPSEQQDLYLLTFTADLALYVASLDTGGASAHQTYVKKELCRIINLSSPSPTRVIRRNLGLCFSGIFAKGDRKLLFETINELVDILSTGKADKNISPRHAAAYCLGAIFESVGVSATSFSVSAITGLLRALKAAQNHTGFRGTIFKALAKILQCIGPSADENLARDVCEAGSVSNCQRQVLFGPSECLWMYGSSV